VSVALSRILLAGDDRDALAATLAKVERLEHFTGAEITVAQIVYDYIAEEPVRPEKVGERDALVARFTQADLNALERRLDPFRSKIASLQGRIVWSKNTADATIELANSEGAELVVKPVTSGDSLADWVRTPTDWSLMRESPCPVLFTKPRERWDRQRCVLVAIDVADTAHAELNRLVLRHAARIAEILAAPLHAVCVYPTLGQSVGDYQVADDFHGLKSDMKESRERALAALYEELEITVEETHVIEGHPARAICQLAEGLGAQITVLGTSARVGLGKLLIGNTAEQIVHRLSTDVLTVRVSEGA
jgi:universal stress protein E